MKKFQVVLLALFALLVAGDCFAALSIDQQAVVDSINTMVSDMTTVAWSLILGITGTLISIRVFRKFANRSV